MEKATSMVRIIFYRSVVSSGELMASNGSTMMLATSTGSLQRMLKMRNCCECGDFVSFNYLSNQTVHSGHTSLYTIELFWGRMFQTLHKEKTTLKLG